MYQILAVIFAALCSAVNSSAAPNSHDWDILIFTQHWPMTVCLEWKEVAPTHTCILPAVKNTWAVHGIWPTKLGTLGPSFCNSSWHFNPKEIAPIQDRLEQYWGNIHSGNRFDLWHHEWDKHGTCAASVPELGSEINYFGRGLTWIDKYNMNEILKRAKILPDDSQYDVGRLFMAVRNELGVDPDVQCLRNHITGVVYLFEIRICFTKTLVLTDCDGVKSVINNKTVITNCPTGQVIIYPTKVEKLRIPWLLDILYIIQWLTV